ncbi:protoporphyrinogen oxidase [Domibacillus epiphyticus]|uniref:Coproporphyrinogen III oxidase n=1 Tax=Domibacillus epiphyticus TaxID=1714355 RepID=A0A1V2A832_9BACI|nr:protoporphyrinogen oxidase [Domibacillus epiphyticus]OMP67126.1 protoporphyrinogen oxidase [Domibacillus epiphyticus]
MEDNRKKVVVIGGGITGLAAAFYLQKQTEQPIDVTLIESSNRLGGKIQTVKRDGFIIERGPDSFLERKTSAARLAKEAGVDHLLTNNAAGKAYVLVGEKLHSMPEGAVMGVPTKVAPFATSSLFSLPGKVRASADFILPKSKPIADQSLGHFFRRRLGDEVVENLIEPLLSGIYAGDIDNLSLMATFPNFYHAEQNHRSLVRGMKKLAPTPKHPAPSEKKKGIFLTLTDGLESLVKGIEAKLVPNSVLKNTSVNRIERQPDGRYLLHLSSGQTIEADSIISTVPHTVLPAMLPDYDFFDVFRKMPATTVATVAMAFPASAVKERFDGTGFVVSRNSDYTITACTWTHKKWPHTTPDDKVLLRCYVGRANDEAVVDLPDADIERIVLGDLNRMMDITGKPEFTIISRWHEAMPQYIVGHKERLAAISGYIVNELPGLYMAGSSFNGLGIPDCIDQGEDAVEKVLYYLRTGQPV